MKNALSIVQRADDECPQSFLGFKSPLGKVEGICFLYIGPAERIGPLPADRRGSSFIAVMKSYESC